MWFLTYYVKNKKSIQNAFAESGTFGHLLLEKFAKGELYAWDLIDEFIDGYDENVTMRFPYNKYVDLGEKNYNCGLNYFEKFEGFDDIGTIVGAEIEVDTYLEDGDIKYPYIGFIDLLLKDNGEYIVLDHKSKSKFKNKKEQAEYSRQLYTYCKYVKEKYGKFPKELIFNMFNADDLVRIEFNIDDYNEAIKWCIDSINEIKNEVEFNKYIDEFFCKNLCNHREICGFEEKDKAIKEVEEC